MDNLGTWRAFFKSMVGFTYICPWPTIVIMFPSATKIFSLLGHEKYVEKNSQNGVMWLVI